MTLSVVIPAHNEEGYIGPCLKSVIRDVARSGREVQIVVVDNASSDRTSAIASRFPGVKVVSEPRKGLSRARHRGYCESTGEIIANVDADCLMPPGYIDLVLRRFQRSRRLALLTGPFYYYDMPQTTQIGSYFFYLFQFFPNVVGQRILGLGAVAQGGNFAVRRSMLDKVGGYDTSLDFYGEDAGIAIRLSKVGLVQFTFQLRMRSSARRMLKQGLFRTGYYYTLNNIFMIFRGRPITRTVADLTVHSEQARAKASSRRAKSAAVRVMPS